MPLVPVSWMCYFELLLNRFGCLAFQKSLLSLEVIFYCLIIFPALAPLNLLFQAEIRFQNIQVHLHRLTENL